MRIVFHGRNAASFFPGFADLLDQPHDIAVLPDKPETDADTAAFRAADMLIGSRFGAQLPRPAGLRLLQAAGAGYDGVDLAALPSQAALCNCFGHEHAIAEYVMAALLRHHIPLEAGDAALRQGLWPFASTGAETVHAEMWGQTIGLLGFGRIGKEIALRAKAFGLRVHAANRSPVPTGELVDQSFGLGELHGFMASADFIVSSLPLLPETTGFVDAAAIAAMRPHALLLNVGRGGVIDPAALYDALLHRRIGGAIIDTWYRYPPNPETPTLPAEQPFHTLQNILMTPHMSGWTDGTIRRRRALMAENANRLASGRELLNLVRAPA